MRQISNFLPEIQNYYFIDELGNIYSKNHKKLIPSIDKYGYQTIRLMTKNGKRKNLFIHRLLMICYKNIDNFENLTVNHKDCNKLNNSLDNLEWVTALENFYHAVENNRTGLSGIHNPNAKLTYDDIKEILCLLETESYQTIAAKFNVSIKTIGNIKNRISFKKEIEEILTNDNNKGNVQRLGTSKR